MLNKYVHMRTQTQAQCTEMKWNIAWLFWRLYFAVVCGAVPVWRVEAFRLPVIFQAVYICHHWCLLSLEHMQMSVDS